LRPRWSSFSTVYLCLRADSRKKREQEDAKNVSENTVKKSVWEVVDCRLARGVLEF
jgi:hypothetical protein